MKILPYSTLAYILIFSGCKTGTQEIAPVKQYSIEQLYNNKNISGIAFNTDESKILVDANVSGIYNLYELNISDTAMVPLTKSTKESFFGVDYLPGTKKFIYSSDQGGNENSHLYLQTPGDTTVKDLTPWPGSTNSFFKWSNDKKYLFVNSNHRNPKFFDLWKMDTSNWKPVLFYQNDSALDPGVLSSTNRYLTLTKSITTDKNELYLFDLSRKTISRLSNDNEAIWNPVAFEKNDSILYYITNDGSEFSYLVKYNIHSGKSEKLFSTDWDVSWMDLSRNEKYRTIFINEDGKNKVLLFDHATGAPVDFPQIQDADIQSIFISESEKNMALSVGSSKSPNNIYVYNFENKQLKQLTQCLNSEVNPNDLVSAQVIRFKSFDGREIPSILYKPINATKDNKMPANALDSWRPWWTEPYRIQQ